MKSQLYLHKTLFLPVKRKWDLFLSKCVLGTNVCYEREPLSAVKNRAGSVGGCNYRQSDKALQLGSKIRMNRKIPDKSTE